MLRLGITGLVLIISYSLSAHQLKQSYCTPAQSCWPSTTQWNELDKQVNGHLIKGISPLQACIQSPDSETCNIALQELKNPFFIESQPGGTQSNGWFNAWNSAVSPYIVAVESAEEIAAAIRFARQHHIKIAIKGTGHDYLGRSNAPDSLLIWTHPMRKVKTVDKFIPKGCPPAHKKVNAVTAEAGTRWLEAYKEVTVNHGRYVQGGGCTSVGVAGGFIQGGGFGSFSKKFGTGAAGILEAELITADGTILTVNTCQNQDLYWALKGGGGGTYGIVSKITLETHPLPTFFGALTGTVKAKSDKDYQDLIQYFINFYRLKLHNEHWGEQVILNPENELQLALVFQGMNKSEVDTLWHPFIKWLERNPERYQVKINSLVLPARTFWDYTYLEQHLPADIIADQRKNATPGEFWWAGNQAEVSIYLTHYQSGYLPFRLFQEENQGRLAKALYDASRLTRLSLHFNKGLSGASTEARARQKNTAMNPAVLDAVALVIVSGGQQYAYPGITGHKPDLAAAKLAADKAKSAMQIISSLSVNSGTYGNEADYFLPNWQAALWGRNYDRLLEIKHKYDPESLFTCHHCVGSE
nr:FAD-dependent oxidoreductase [Legionella shakespearei]